MYELSVPDTSYSGIVTRLSNKIREPIPASSPDTRFLENRRKRMQQQCELLPQEMKRQMHAKAVTAARLRREKNYWFPVCEYDLQKHSIQEIDLYDVRCQPERGRVKFRTILHSSTCIALSFGRRLLFAFPQTYYHYWNANRKLFEVL
jgi:hypothetical protein